MALPLDLGCRLVLPQDAAELHQPKASDILEPLGSLESDQVDAHRSEGIAEAEGAKGAEGESDRTCCICLDENADAKLPCGHKYHASCLESWFEQRPSCPTCGQFYGDRMGSMPDGSMSWGWRKARLAGYTCFTIVLHFNFQSGTQNGQAYDGRSQHAYLPDNDTGRKLLAMFQLAFRRRVLFSLTQSLTTGRWQPTFAIHLKTSMTGGPAMHGYPDDQYFDTATEELRLAGIDLDTALPVAICLHRVSSQMLKLRCAACSAFFFVTLVQRTLPFAGLLVLTMSTDGRMILFATISVGFAIILPPKPATLILLFWFFLTAASSAPLNPKPWVVTVTMTVMIISVLFALGHVVARTRPCFGRIRAVCIRTFQRSEAKLAFVIFLLLVSGAWQLDGFGTGVFVVECAAFLVVLLFKCLYWIFRRRYAGGARALPFGTEPLLSDMQQVLENATADGPVVSSNIPPLGPLQDEDWATYASTPSLQGRTDMQLVHQAFLRSLEAEARNKASSVVHEMLANEKLLFEAFVPMYHLYSVSGLLYELQTVLAVELLSYPLTGPPVMRLSRKAFADVRSISNLLAVRERNASDRAHEYRSLAVSAFSSCFGSGGYHKSMQQYLWGGFPSGTANYVNKLIEDLLSSVGLTDPDLLSNLKSRIKTVGTSHGFTEPFGQVLQIFVHKSVVDAFAYGAQPLGALAPRGIPLTAWLQQQCPLEGQVRLVPHPDLFLNPGHSRQHLVKIFDFCPSKNLDKVAMRRELQAVLRPYLNPARAKQLLGYAPEDVAEFPAVPDEVI